METYRDVKNQRSIIQNMVFFSGLIFFLFAIFGLIVPGLFKMHLSFLHNMIYLLTSFLAFYSSLINDFNKAKSFCSYMGIFYLVLAALGYLLGQPGFPGVGNLSEDQNLLKVIPNVLEFGRNDHHFHFIMATFLLFLRVTSRKLIQVKA
jgi:hypothetical protein